eukprot:365771-Chlamydomonas_euryale.AAC.12
MHATVHGAHAFALHALGQLPLSFEHAVKAVVMRTQTLGRAHVDTQVRKCGAKDVWVACSQSR